MQFYGNPPIYQIINEGKTLILYVSKYSVWCEKFFRIDTDFQ
jgi:hypothetical protein